MERRNFISKVPVMLAAFAAGTSNLRASQLASSNTTRYINVMDYGAIGDGSHDDTSAIQGAITSLSATGGGIYFPPGNYVVSSTITLIPNLTISGFGATSVKIFPQATGINVFQYLPSTEQPANISISGLEIDCTSVSGITGFYIQLSNNIYFHGIVFTGCDYSIQLDQCSYAEINSCVSRGSPYNKAGTLKLFSTSATNYINQIKVTDYFSINIGNGIANGHAIIVQRGVAVFIEGFSLNDGHVGGDVRGVAFYGDCQGCKVSNTGVGACGSGIFFGKDIFISSSIIVPSFATISSVDIDQPQIAGICLSTANWITIIGGSFTSSNANVSATGVLVQVGNFVTVTGVTVNGFSNGNGILIGGGVSNLTISNCQVNECATGIGVVSGNGQYLSLMGNRLAGNTTALNYGATGGGSLVRNNIGAADIA